MMANGCSFGQRHQFSTDIRPLFFKVVRHNFKEGKKKGQPIPEGTDQDDLPTGKDSLTPTHLGTGCCNQNAFPNQSTSNMSAQPQLLPTPVPSSTIRFPTQASTECWLALTDHKNTFLESSSELAMQPSLIVYPETFGI